jgi:hypothetical protein
VAERDLAGEADEDVEPEQGDDEDRDERELLGAEVRERAREQRDRCERRDREADAEG